MVDRWAHVVDGAVDNISLWDGVEYDPETGTGWTPPDEADLHRLPEDSPVGVGWTYDGTEFNPPPDETAVSISTQWAEARSIAALKDVLSDVVPELGT